MYAEKSWSLLEQWIDTPQKKPNPETPDVEVVLIGEYAVTGSRGSVYQVIFGENKKPMRTARLEDALFFAACTCKGNLHRMPCRHIKAAWPIHKAMAEIETE